VSMALEPLATEEPAMRSTCLAKCVVAVLAVAAATACSGSKEAPPATTEATPSATDAPIPAMRRPSGSRAARDTAVHRRLRRHGRVAPFAWR
jgi:hypothetical protein